MKGMLMKMEKYEKINFLKKIGYSIGKPSKYEDLTKQGIRKFN